MQVARWSTVMPDRYGDRDEDDEPPVVVDQSVVDFESRRQDRQLQAAKQRAIEQRHRLAETRATHAPLSREQSQLTRQHRAHVTDHANAERRAMQIRNCGLCDDEGYRGCGAVCDHVDRTRTHSRGMAAVRQAMGWEPTPAPIPIKTASPDASQPRTGPPDSTPTPTADVAPGGESGPTEVGGW